MHRICCGWPSRCIENPLSEFRPETKKPPEGGFFTIMPVKARSVGDATGDRFGLLALVQALGQAIDVGQ